MRSIRHSLPALGQFASYLEPDRPHQRQCVGVLDDAGTHEVVEAHFAVLEMVGEMDVHGDRTKGGDDLGEGEVMRGDQADRAAVEQASKNRLGSGAAVVRVGAVEELVEEKKERQRTAGQVDELSNTGDLCIEPRLAGLK